MNKNDLEHHLQQYTAHEEIYRSYYELGSEEEKKSYLQTLKNSSSANENLWLPGFFDLDHLLLSEQALFSLDAFWNKNIVIQKHNRYTPAILHEHEFFEMIYVYSGQANHLVQDNNHLIVAGDLLILAPYVPHALSVYDDSIVLNALIRKGTFFNQFFELLKKDNILSSFFQRDLYSNKHQPCITFHTSKDAELEDLLFAMYLEQRNEDDFSTDIISNLCRVYFAKLVRHHQSHVEVYHPISKEKETLLLIMSYIQNNYHEITLTTAAKHFHYAPAYLSNYIKEHTGTTFVKLVQDAKLKRAEFLLLNTNLSIQEICQEIGYESTPHFIRLFKSIYQLSPFAYRKKHSNPFS